MSDADTVRQTLQDLAKETLRLDDALPAGDLAEHLDSAERLALVIAVEDHYAIAFDEDDEQAATFDEVVALVQRKLAAKP